MKWLYLALFLALILLISDGSAEKTRKHKKYRRPHKKATTEQPIDSNENIKTSDDNPAEPPPEESSNEESSDIRAPLIDPCFNVHCGPGRVCELGPNSETECVCIPTCPEETESRRKVCSNHNETWTSDCAVYQQRCFCQTGNPKCKGDKYQHTHIEYYGECREMPDCTEEEMSDFPRRMRDWLFNIMKDLAERDELSKHYMELQREAGTNLTKRWTNAAIWKFCDLDGSPPDRSVSRHELFPIRAPLMSLEHCIAPFLDSCDSNNDHKITIQEWAKCLKLEEDEINEQCEEIQIDQE